VALITIGLIFLAERLDWGRDWRFDQLWPLILIAIGFVHLLVPGKDGRRWGGLWLVLVGGLLLLNQLRVLMLHQTWPLFIVAGGLAILFGRGRRSRGDRPPQNPGSTP
jgi:hypothetical protein